LVPGRRRRQRDRVAFAFGAIAPTIQDH
jgi:hypothetical protein